MKAICIIKTVETVPFLHSFLINTGINPGVNEKVRQSLAVSTAYFRLCTPLIYLAGIKIKFVE